MRYPLWATPERRACLVELFLQSGGFCIHEGISCMNPAHSYPVVSEDIIELWKADDREERSYVWQRERHLMHRAPRIRRRGRFDSIRREQWLAERPQFIVVAIGVNAFTQHRMAKVEIPELEKTVWVDISCVKLSKNKLRKMTRHACHSKGVPEELHKTVAKAVRRYV